MCVKKSGLKKKVPAKEEDDKDDRHWAEDVVSALKSRWNDDENEKRKGHKWQRAVLFLVQCNAAAAFGAGLVWRVKN